MRIFDESNQAVKLDQLDIGVVARNRKDAMVAEWNDSVTGPTGSGKSTSFAQYSVRAQYPDVNISTIEDPVEYKILRSLKPRPMPKLEWPSLQD